MTDDRPGASFIAPVVGLPSMSRDRDARAIARVDAIVTEYGYLLDRVGALRQRIAEVDARNAPINQYAPTDQQIPVVLTGDEILAILNGEAS